jgi:hypothetical protein
LWRTRWSGSLLAIAGKRDEDSMTASGMNRVLMAILSIKKQKLSTVREMGKDREQICCSQLKPMAKVLLKSCYNNFFNP